MNVARRILTEPDLSLTTEEKCKLNRNLVMGFDLSDMRDIDLRKLRMIFMLST